MNTQHYDNIAKMNKGEEIRIFKRDWAGTSNPRIVLDSMCNQRGYNEKSKRGKQFYGKEFSVTTLHDSFLIYRKR